MLHLDVKYMKSTPGVLVVVACAAFAGVSCSGLSVSIFSIESLMSGSLAFLYVTKLHQKFTWFSWPAVDFMNSVIGVLYMISISTAAVYHAGTVKMYIAGVVSFLTFICYVASTAVALMTVPLIEFLWALFTFFAYSTKLNEQMKGLLWPLLDFIRCVSAAIIYFVISLVAVSKYTCGASKAAAVLGFVATIVFAFDFYLIFNDLTKFLKKGEPAGEPEAQKSDDEEFDSDSD
ncbi:CKLF-like MARVEL transmembrane domain-containing protein 3 isoform X1 [Spea bombifrons]|uniref:CKLF-like MARVEL transmembrane domain-containing protein 3 isoform X1 n=1 Tax=Spea bombifrons TaxID=233779 RepID=UPI0023499E77|nr:CKLF-like MARVEL transmembrane domain-containing protein 3 isoform X1 [Spea bombifrons]